MIAAPGRLSRAQMGRGHAEAYARPTAATPPLLQNALTPDLLRAYQVNWLDGWAGRPCHNGPTLVVTITDEQRFIGIVGFGERDEGSVEMIYGVAPRWRRRGLASRAVRFGALWALGLPGVSTVELRIDQDMVASQHVAVNAGFRLVGTASQFVPGTGETFEDLRYVLGQSSKAVNS